MRERSRPLASHRAARRLMIAAAVGVGGGPAEAAPPAKTTAPPTVQVDPVIVTGTRDLNKKARDSSSPIQVISSAAIRRTGSPNLADALVHINPSIDAKTMGYDTAALTASVRLRGLGPNETLVLLDGIRRHTTSNISADAGPEQGTTPVDLNMIAPAAIDHIEVLEDGAAALYGSDAIAGVVNIITKKTDHGGSLDVETGADAVNGDGWLTQIDGDKGARFGKDGYIHVAGQIYHKDFFVEPTVDDRAAVDHFDPGLNKVESSPEETRELLTITEGTTIAPDLWGGLQQYSLITFGHRHAESYENYRYPTSSSNVLAIYPGGYSPRETDEENDYAATLGLKAPDIGGFHVNVSTTWGADETDIGVKNTLNASLYALTGFSPTNVLAQTQSTAQWTNDLDVVRPFLIQEIPVNLAFGAEHRLDLYGLGAGSPASYLDGGTQGFAGLLPQDAGNWSRDVYAGYADIDVHPVPKWDIDLAGRFEHYTDFGNAETGKVATRYDFTKWLAARATISNGFQAPTLAQEHYSALNVSPTDASGILAVNSPGARLIGAEPLKPERSTNVSAGLVLQPVSRLSVTADVYQINLRDRIVAAGDVTGTPAVAAIAADGVTLPPNAVPAQTSAYYFANGASTRTQGLDITASYSSMLDDWGTVAWSLGIDLNRTRLDHLGTSATGQSFLTVSGVSNYTTAYPRSKIIGDALWRIGKWDINVRETRWGSSSQNVEYYDLAPAAIAFNGNITTQFVNTPVWTSDLEIGYQLAPRWHVAVGGLNVFDMQPRRENPLNSYLGVEVFTAGTAGLPEGGGFYYGRVGYTF